jgi:hypothetical protein
MVLASVKTRPAKKAVYAQIMPFTARLANDKNKPFLVFKV